MHPIEKNTGSYRLATIGGMGAILLWSTTVAIVRSLSEQVGPLTAAAAVFTVSAVLALFPIVFSSQRRQRLRRLPPAYLFGCGGLFAGYMVLLFIAIGSARDRQQVLEVALLNYMWPTLTLLSSLPLLGKRANRLLWPGTVLALAGVFIVVTSAGSVSWRSFTANLSANPLAYTLALAAAVFWALYSVLTRKWAGVAQEGGVPIFLLLTAVLLFALSWFMEEAGNWAVRSWMETLFLGIATYAAYSLWDHAMRKGHITVVAAASYLTPLFSTIVSSCYLAVWPGMKLWLGCFLLIVGSVLSWRSVADS